MGTEIDPATGLLDVKCTMDKIDITKNGVTTTRNVPVCHIKRDADDVEYQMDTNVMYKFVHTKLSNNSTASQNVSFQATTMPDWTEQLRTLMSAGGQWDNVLSSNVKWTIKTSSLTRQARAHISWHRLFEQASTFAAIHLNSCVDVQVQSFFSKLVDCNAEDECGVRMEYLQPDGTTWGPKAPNDANFVNVINALDTQLRGEIFNEVAISPTLGRVSTDNSAIFTLRANYEKVTLDRNEVREVVYNPGPTTAEATTALNIDCLLGGFEDGRVSWDLSRSGCAALLGR
jgi:hypothetical protein